jgi:flagellar hook assembly protein FlgD
VTTIRYRVPPTDGRLPVTLDVFDVAGRRVRRLVGSSLPAGEHSVQWDGTGENGAAAGSGIYFYRLTVDGRTLTRKMVLAR